MSIAEGCSKSYDSAVVAVSSHSGQSDAFRWDGDSRGTGPSKLDEAKLDEALFLLRRITSSKEVAMRQNSRQASHQKIPSR